MLAGFWMLVEVNSLLKDFAVTRYAFSIVPLGMLLVAGVLVLQR